ncbi:hypothetical protein EUTSA_v10002375mg [Eutrema salsugineum]|uniref:Uncharacterized protein n=1 Tax=Eutrema salsugineum TaxID=72664 RepID=V4L4H6_EUTSA|nr:SNF2 domain-containing protein CLASSY 4 [Eutrema salsugineum]ESQ37192.1 hypothetical protein EUTSA_v10002375mg [Eutrema salsugineum]
MDMATCVARRTRSRTESYLNDLLNKSKGISVEEQSKARRERQKKRNSIRDACSSQPPAKSKRCRKKASENEDVEFIETIYPGGKRKDEHVVVEDDNVASPSLIAPTLESRSPDPDRVRDLPVDDDANSKGVEKTHASTTPAHDVVDDDDDFEYLGYFPREKEHVDDYNVDKVCDLSVDDADDVEYLGSFPREKKHVDDCNVDKVFDLSVDESNLSVENADLNVNDTDLRVNDADLNGEEKTPTLTPSAPVNSETDEVMSLSSSSQEGVSTEDDSDEDVESSDEDVESDSSDYMEESSDSSYNESSESDFDCSDDDEFGARDTAKVRKSQSERVYTGEKQKNFPRKNDMDVFRLLAKSIWNKTKIFEEDICSGDETAEDDYSEEPIVRESSSEKVYKDQRKRRRSHREKEKNHLNVTDLLGNSFCGDGESFDGGEKPWRDLPPLNLRFGCCEEPEPIEKTEEEMEIDSLWEDMNLALTLEGVNSSSAPAKSREVPCTNGKHDFILDEEIGLKCCYCSYVSVEIRDISPAMDKYRGNVNEKKTCRDKKCDPLLNGLDFEASDRSNYDASLKDTQGTVWEYIPGVKETLYPHQREGFEFIWKNLAGSTKLDELKSSVVKGSGGCIISHSPGTGKTRLTIVFLQSYLEQFPDSHPVVIAPASLLFTWEEEFKKWDASAPFYNMNNMKFSGQENQSAIALLKGNSLHRSNKHSVRMVKLYSWRNKKSILGVSYNLYEKLARNKYAGEMEEFRRMLLELPGLLVLDEGHTPRNQNSCIWKALSEVKTEKRIILSGTPFQNNFKELSNVLCLARPAYTDTISSRLQDLSKLSQEGKNGKFDEEIGIGELKDMIAPFVHVHKGNILRESLPGLRDRVVVLNPSYLQKKILDRIDHTQTTFELEHKLSAVSVHPSLYTLCNPTKIETLTIGPKTLETLERLRLDSKEGVKTRFLINFIRFSETVKEKVLVFSQYIDTLKLIMDQVCAAFGWREGKEILIMHGNLEQKDRPHLIHNFNKPDSESKVLLASTKACSEGISLVGASRVVLLDVVWNPSVEMQAISRAYRIGQKRVVYTYHLMVKDASEWEKYRKQTKKHRISEMVFSPTDDKDKLVKNQVVSEDRILDEMVRHEKLKDMFEKILYRPKESDMFTNIL